MICPMALTSGKIMECLKKRCPLWIKFDDGNWRCLQHSHFVLEYILMKRALTSDEQLELMNKEIVEKKNEATYL